jgi:hypothetical protein
MAQVAERLPSKPNPTTTEKRKREREREVGGGGKEGENQSQERLSCGSLSGLQHRQWRDVSFRVQISD